MKLNNELVRFLESTGICENPQKVVAKYFGDIGFKGKRRLALAEIENLYKEIFDITGCDLRSKSRKRHYVYLRAVFYEVGKQRSQASYVMMAEYIGKNSSTASTSRNRSLEIVMKHSEFHRNLYYRLMGIKDPRVSKIVMVDKSYLRSLLNNYDFFLKDVDKTKIRILLQ